MRTEWCRSIRPLNESCNQWLRRSTEASAREADHLQTNLPDDSALVRPTVAQKPEPGGPVKSIDMAPSRHWHPTIPENACMVSDAFPSLVSRIVAIWSPGCSLLLTDRLPLPPSAPSFPHPPDRRDDNHHHCIKQMSVVARGSQTIFPSPIAWVCFVALPFNLRRVPNAAF